LPGFEPVDDVCDEREGHDEWQERPGRFSARRWIPEYASSPEEAILDPTIGRRPKQLALPLFAGADHPLPILDYERAARAFLEPYQREVIPA